jgi:FkbM family methyltransferase
MSITQSLRQLLKRSSRLVALVKNTRTARRELALTVAKLKVPKANGYLLSAYGVWLRDRWDDATCRYCVLGEYGFFYSNWLQEQEDCIFLDIGSNIGLYSLIACRNPGIRAVYAFEPVPETFGYLVQNLRKNAADRCQACPVGISSVSEELSVMTKKGHSGVSTLRDTGLAHIGYDSRTTVKVVGPDYLDALVDTSLANRIVAKIDVEGHEQVVINALMKSKIWPRVSNIYYEVNERYLDHQAVLSRLQADGFEVIYQNGAGGAYDLMVQRVLPDARA